MEEILTQTNILIVVGVFAFLVLVMVLAFGRDRAWEALVAVYRRLTGGGGTNVVLALIVAGSLAGCAAFPRTAAAYNQGGVGPAIDEFLTQAGKRIVAVCSLGDGSRLSSVIELAALATDRGARVAEIRAERRSWCAALGGALLLDVQ